MRRGRQGPCRIFQPPEGPPEPCPSPVTWSLIRGLKGQLAGEQGAPQFASFLDCIGPSLSRPSRPSPQAVPLTSVTVTIIPNAAVCTCNYSRIPHSIAGFPGCSQLKTGGPSPSRLPIRDIGLGARRVWHLACPHGGAGFLFVTVPTASRIPSEDPWGGACVMAPGAPPTHTVPGHPISAASLLSEGICPKPGRVIPPGQALSSQAPACCMAAVSA